MEDAFASKQVHPGDLKAAVANALNNLLDPIRKSFQENPELIKLTNEAYPPPKPKIVAEISKLDIRVGRIVSVKQHPEKEALYVEEIDLGEGKPRTIVSGLAKFMTLNELENRLVLVAANLKPSKFAGVLSEGMVLAASNSDKTLVELLEPPVSAKPGSRVTFEGYDIDKEQGILNPKHKIFEKCSAEFAITEDCVATYKDVEFQVDGIPVKVKSLKQGIIS